ncbi:MAG: DUF4159 domain-containing protein [Longimicrobiales bacterium]
MRRGGLILALAALGVGGFGLPRIPGLPGGVGGGLSSFLAGVPPSAPLRQEGEEGPDYNGKFTFIRIKYGDYETDLRSFRYGGRGRRGGGRGRQAPWEHDYPRAETNFAKIVEATTFIDTYTEGASGRVLTLDDPELFKYPIASIIEVGYWNPSDAEILNLRNWLLKGGFLIVDDTRQDRGFEFQNFASQMGRALPEYEILPVPPDHEIYDSFFRIEDPQALVPPYGRHEPVYLGIFEGNDRVDGRLMVMINFNTDLQEYWEFSDRGYYPIDLSNEAYKFGVNYLVYAFTH